MLTRISTLSLALLIALLPGAWAQESRPKAAGGFRQYPMRSRGVRAPSPKRPSASPVSQLNKRTIADAITQPTQLGSTEGGFEIPNWDDPDFLQQGTTIKRVGDMVYQTSPKLHLGELYAEMDSLDTNTVTRVMHGKGSVFFEQGVSTLRASEFTYYPPDEPAAKEPSLFDQAMAENGTGDRLSTAGKLDISNVDLREPTREIVAAHIFYDFSEQTGSMSDARGRAGIYYFAAEEVEILGPQKLKVKNLWVTTCDHDPPHYRVRLSNASLD